MSSPCVEAASLALARSLDVLDPGEEETLAQHLAGCASCSESVPLLGKGIEAERLAAPANSWERIEAELAAREKKQDAPAPLVKLVCTYCHGELERESAVYCASCLAPCHQECFIEHGRCAAPGCSETRIVRAREPVLPIAPALTFRESAPARSRASRVVRVAVITLCLGSAAFGATVFLYVRAYEASLARMELERAEQRQRAISGRDALAGKPRRGGAELWRARGLQALGNGDLVGALTELDRALLEDPADAASFEARGEAHRRLGELDRALDDLGRAIELDPTNARIWTTLGSARRDQQEIDRALECYTKAIALDPGNTRALIQRGALRATKPDAAGALADLDRAIALDPKDAAAYGHRGYIRCFQKEYAAASQDALEALRLDPMNALARVLEGLLLAKDGDADGAIAKYSQAIQLDPRLYAAWLARATARHGKGALDAAILDYEQALKLRPRETTVWLRCGQARLESGDLARAISDCDKAMELDARPDAMARVLNVRAVARLKKRDFEGAIGDYEKALELDPKGVEAESTRSKLGELRATRSR